MSEFSGKKWDKNKLRWDLLPWNIVTKVVKVLTYGAEKYEANNWQKLENGKDRHFAAAMRHIVAWRSGEILDQESRIHHLAHAACCIIFIIWLDEKEIEVEDNRMTCICGGEDWQLFILDGDFHIYKCLNCGESRSD